MFRRLLIANRGEIAVRVIRACREMGIESVAVYSDADADALHVSLADQAWHIGPAPAADSYLSIETILDAARQANAEAIHPGYGFLAENARFARACADAGIAFVGPPADVIEQMGSKIGARELAARAGVPVVPGTTPPDQSTEAIATAARHIGLPVLLKPSAGGGGIGMKIVRDDTALTGAIVQARREAVAAFADGALYVERLIDRPRHVEFQILADAHGHIVHLFERECSIQRRHQKILEESPSPALTADMRRRMGDAAVALARASHYRNAGTVEFLLEGEGDAARFYFLEMNTRLQVEHPITEQVTGVDLVRAQIMLAAGEVLPWVQRDITQRGHAIELRVYAEDPQRADLPQAGRLLVYREPIMPGIRTDSGVMEGAEVPVHYDPLLAKLIASAETRQHARLRALAALRCYPVLGIRTNIPLLCALLEHPRFIAGDVDTWFLEEEIEAIRARLADAPTPEVLRIAEAARASSPPPSAAVSRTVDPWSTLDVRI
jgi:acetyl-CoA carboxylase biotin carboxylase subunit